MSCQRNTGKITVPDELRDILLEFTISYLLEQPVDIIEYAVGFFTQLRDSRQTQLIQPTAQTCSSTPDESVDEGERENFHSGCDFPSRRVFVSQPSDTYNLPPSFERAVSDTASILKFDSFFCVIVKLYRCQRSLWLWKKFAYTYQWISVRSFLLDL